MGLYVVTGAATGIGAAVCGKLAQDGHRIITVDVRGDVEVTADLSHPAGRADALERIAREASEGIDGLVPCAGLGPHVTPTPAIARLNFFGVMAMVNGIRSSLARRHGAIVLIASNTVATVAPSPYTEALLAQDETRAVALAAEMDGQAVYAQGKLALVHWMRRHTDELAADGIRINAVAPGFTRTPLTEAGLSNPEYGPMIERFLQSIPLKREAQPAEIASVACFLLRREASYVSGAVLYVDGGYDAKTRPDAC